MKLSFGIDPDFTEADKIAARRKANAERQKAFRERKIAIQQTHVHGYVHSHQLPGLMDMIRALEADPDLEVGPAKSSRTGRLVRV